MTTSNYIYETLFEKGEGSDITVTALGQTWKLHLIYLKQSQYFDSYFGGRWPTPEDNCINLEIPDSHIDAMALHTVFGSLYCDEIKIPPNRAVNVLAAASLLQHRGLINHCSEIMISYLNATTVTSYYTAAITYGLPDVEKGCIQWLENNLMIETSGEILRGIDVTLMGRLICSPELAVIQVEMDVYQLLKKWLYIQLQQEDEIILSDMSPKTIMAFLNTLRQNSLSILESIDSKYYSVFEGLRLTHIITDFKCANTIENEHIIPRKWVYQQYRSQWLRMLRVENSYDSGPTEQICSALQEHERLSTTASYNDEISPKIKTLYHSAMRCGRILEENKDFCWRWTGYNYGFDLIMTYSHQKHLIQVARNCLKQEVSTSVSLKQTRSFICKVKVFTLKRDGSLDLCHNSGWRHFSLEKEQEKGVIQISKSKRRLYSQNKMFMVAYMLFAEPAEMNYYLPKSLLIKKSLLSDGSFENLPNSSNIVPCDLHGNSS